MLTLIAQTMAPEAYLKAGPVVGLATLMGFLAAIFFKTLEQALRVGGHVARAETRNPVSRDANPPPRDLGRGGTARRRTRRSEPQVSTRRAVSGALSRILSNARAAPVGPRLP